MNYLFHLEGLPMSRINFFDIHFFNGLIFKCLFSININLHSL